MQPLESLTAQLVELLAPVVRDVYTYTADAQEVTGLNPTGIDLHMEDVRTVAQSPDGSASPYMVLWPQAGTDLHPRMSRGRSATTWGFQLTVAAGSRRGCLWALDLARGQLQRARLNGATGILTPYFDQVDVLVDRGASPPRWFAPLRYTTSVH